MTPPRWHARTPPPWWPANEPWPPIGPQHRWRRGRRFFLFRVAGFLLFGLLFGLAGLFRLVMLLSERAGLTLPPAVVAAGVVALLVAIVPLLFVAGMRRVGLPLGDIVSAADRVGGGDYSARLIERGPPFLRSVARAFNKMTTRLDAQERQRRDLMADVAHELRTPLSIMRGRLEGLLDGVYPRDDATISGLVEETTHLERLVEDLRTLAHADGGTLKLQRETTDLAVLVNEVTRSFEPAAGTAGVALRVTTGDLTLIDVDPLRIREVMGNLLSNALRHTPRGGSVTVAAEVSGDRIRVSVADTGSGIHPDDLPRIFDRFTKGTGSRGSGLGLAIAKNLVAAHGGEIKAESDVGRGALMTFTLPARVT